MWAFPVITAPVRNVDYKNLKKRAYLELKVLLLEVMDRERNSYFCIHFSCDGNSWSFPIFRTVYEDSGPGRPLSYFMEEPAPYTDTTGAAGGGNCRFVESPSQDQRLQAQRLRTPEVRGPVQTPQNRPHGHQSPDLPEGYGKSFPEPWNWSSFQQTSEKNVPSLIHRCGLPVRTRSIHVCLMVCILERELSSADGRLAN